MPYIKLKAREYIKNRGTPGNAGELNYAFTLLCMEYIKYRGESYQIYNDIIGALEGCKLELYRRKAAVYENKKIKENGDVWE